MRLPTVTLPFTTYHPLPSVVVPFETAVALATVLVSYTFVVVLYSRYCICAFVVWALNTIKKHKEIAKKRVKSGKKLFFI